MQQQQCVHDNLINSIATQCRMSGEYFVKKGNLKQTANLSIISFVCFMNI